MITGNDWLEKGVETIFDERFCHIMCRVIVAHLFRFSSQRRRLPNVSHKMARIVIIDEFEQEYWEGYECTLST